MADPKLLRNLKIKTSVVKRLEKDKIMYEREIVEQENKIQSLKDTSADEHDIRKQTEVLEESRSMVPDVSRKAAAARDELRTLLESAGDLADTEEYKAAKEIVEKQ